MRALTGTGEAVINVNVASQLQKASKQTVHW